MRKNLSIIIHFPEKFGPETFDGMAFIDDLLADHGMEATTDLYVEETLTPDEIRDREIKKLDDLLAEGMRVMSIGMIDRLQWIKKARQAIAGN